MIRLTQLVKAAGWAAKIGPADLYNLLKNISLKKNDNIVVSFDTSDDAGVYRLGDKLLVQTVDVITPVVDEPYIFGKIAVINALSDIYAMGGDPLSALSILMYDCKLDSSIIKEVLNGAVEALNNENCALLGGHTIEDSEIKLGFSVTGVISDGKIYRNSTLKENNFIILTKPIGTGIISTALKANMVDECALSSATHSMTTSNKKASLIMKKYNVSACTDVTGFSLAGHLYEMAYYSKVSIDIDVKHIPIIDGTLKYASMGLIPAGAYRNKNFLSPFVEISNVDEQFIMPLFDPQTSGGLLIGVEPSDAEAFLDELKREGYNCSIIGKTIKKREKLIIFT